MNVNNQRIKIIVIKSGEDIELKMLFFILTLNNLFLKYLLRL